MLKRIFMINLLLISLVFAWGDKGHMLIAEYAIRSLPADMEFFHKYMGYFIAHSTDPDYRKDKIKNEAVKHFIDIDFYPNYQTDTNIYDYNFLANSYTKDTVNRMGILPWATQETYYNLVKALKSNDTLAALVLISDLCHYVADGHQPQHTTMNYNGQLTNQKGIHFRYEVDMFDKYEVFWRNNLKLNLPKKIDQPLNKYIFNYIISTNKNLEIVHSADYKLTKDNKIYNENYYKSLFEATKDVTLLQLQNAINNLSNLLYNAYLESLK